MTDRNKFRLWTRALASTGLVAIATIAATPASAACVSVLGVTIQTDLLGNTCINGGQTGPASTNGTAIGAGATVLGADGIAIGVGAQSSSDGAIVLGDGSTVTGLDGLAIGAGANVLGDRGVGLGLGALVGGVDGVAIGNGARSDGFRGIAIGAGALSLLEADLAIGRFSRAGAPGDPFGSNTAFGDGAVASGGFASAFGANSTAVGLNTVAIGAASNASSPGSVALGAGATATTPDSVAIGRNAVAAGADLTTGVVAPATAGPVTGVAFDNTTGVNAGAVSVGAAGDARQVRNVADGSTATDAVNVRQLSGVVAQTNGALNALDGRVTANTTAIAGLDARTTANEGAIAGLQGQIATGTVGLVRQDQATRGITVGGTTDGSDVNVAGTGGTRTISGVTAGSAPDQATNAAQLAAVVATFGPGATLNADGSVTIPAYAVQGTAQNTVGGAIGVLDTGLTDVRTQVAAINRTADGAYMDINTQAPPATAAGADSAAIGGGATATADNSVALGSGSVADRGPQVAYVAPYVTTPQTSVGELSVGAPGAERQITNVAAGSAATDAVNVAQLQGGLATTVRYDTLPSGGTNYGSVTLGNGSGAVALHNVAPGTVGTDAVNLDQLRSVSFDMGRDLQRYRTDAQRGTAVALAATGMRFDDRPGRTSIGGAVSVFRGETGVAMGVGHTSSNQRLRYNAAVSFSPNGGSNVGAVAGATFSFGGD